MAFEHWFLFTMVALTASLTPGPAVLLVTTHSLQYGPARAIATIAGNVSGLFVMSLASVLGLGGLVLHSPQAFWVVKLAGAAYLVWIGARFWRTGIQMRLCAAPGASLAPLLPLYRQGVLLALTNPKAILFTTALFPQFVDVQQPLMRQFTILVSTFMAGSFLCLTGYALLGHRLRLWRADAARLRWSGRLVGLLFIALGLALLGLSAA